jgi:hypothetical protein
VLVVIKAVLVLLDILASKEELETKVFKDMLV